MSVITKMFSSDLRSAQKLLIETCNLCKNFTYLEEKLVTKQQKILELQYTFIKK